MLEWVKALKNVHFLFWKIGSDTTSEQLAGLLTISLLVHAYAQSITASIKDAKEVGWVVIGILSVLLMVYYLVGNIIERRFGILLSNIWRLSRLLLIHFLLSMLFLVTNHYMGQNRWIDYEIVAENSPYIASALCSILATVILLIHSISYFQTKKEIVSSLPACIVISVVSSFISGMLLVYLGLLA